MTASRPAHDELLSPAEAAALFRVTAKTVTTWAREGRIHALRTPGGHRRFYRSELEQLRTERETVAVV
jgi:excisionase family DNA binding protein